MCLTNSKICNNCKDVILRDNFYSLQDYMNCLNYIKDLIDNNNFKIVEQTCDLLKVKNEDNKWIADIIFHKIECKECGSLFEVWCDTYHGKGGFKKM